MRGIDFVMNKSGKKTAVLIDLKRHGQLWEDFYDTMLTDSRAHEPRDNLESVRRRLKLKRRSNG